MKQLFLYNTAIGVPDCEALCELQKSSHLLEPLDIDLNNLSPESVASIITGLNQNSSLSNSHFSIANVEGLAVLRDVSTCALTKLELCDCHITSVELVAALCENTKLGSLDLGHIANPIGENMTAVAKMLTLSQMLQSVAEVILSHPACIKCLHDFACMIF